MPHKDPAVAKEYFRQRYLRQYDPVKAKQYYQDNRERLLKRGRKDHLRVTYNMTLEQYDAMVQEQKYCCAICGFPEHRYMKNKKIKPLSIDHEHTTGKIRKLLCNDCNAALGFAKEDPTRLQAMIAYLKEHNGL